MRPIVLLFCSALFIWSCNNVQPESTSKRTDRQSIHQDLDQWHEAAERADFNSYFSHFSDSAVFIGTDAGEYWTIEEFKTFARPYFERGRAWSFTPQKRNVYVSDRQQIAWFDEQLHTPHLGPVRGSGVLSYSDDSWKIEHYTLSIPIPNAIVDTVVGQIQSYHNNPPSP